MRKSDEAIDTLARPVDAFWLGRCRTAVLGQLIVATELGLNGQAGGAYSEMAEVDRPRLLDVNVRALEPDRWEWQGCDAGVPLARGFEAARETAQIKGDDALFLLLSKSTR